MTVNSNERAITTTRRLTSTTTTTTTTTVAAANHKVNIQYGNNCNGETVVRVLLHDIHLTSRREVDSLLHCLERSIATVEEQQEQEQPRERRRNKSDCCLSEQTTTRTLKRDRCILDIQMCDLNQHMEALLRQTILRQPEGFDGLDIMGEDESAQAARLELISNSNIRFLPPLTMSISIAKVLRDVLRGNQGRLDYLSLTSMPVSQKAAKIIFEDGLKTTRRNKNLGGLMLRGCSFEDEPILPRENDNIYHEEDEDDDDNNGNDDSDDNEQDRSSTNSLATPAAHLAEGLRLNTTLKFLDISLVFWTDLQLEAILKAIVHHPTLTKVDLEGSVFGPRSIRALKTVLQSPQCRIKALDLSQLNYVRDIGKDRIPLDKAGLLDALESSQSLEQIILNHNNYFSFVDLARIIRLLRKCPRVCHVTYDDFIPDGTPRMITIALRSTIRVLLHRNRHCHRFLFEAARCETSPSVWPHCLARANRILRTDQQRGQALFPIVQAFFGIPGAIPITDSITSERHPDSHLWMGLGLEDLTQEPAANPRQKRKRE